MVAADRGASLGRRIAALGLTVLLLAGTLVVGWLVWSVVEWRHGRTPSYRILGLRVVRLSDARPVGLGRSLLRSGICCPLLVVPTVLIGAIVGFCFAMGASPPDGLLRQPRTAPWDFLTSTKVLDERVLPAPAPDAGTQPVDPVTPPGPTVLGAPRTNGHGPR